MDEIRKAFEAWARSELGADDYGLSLTDDGEYHDKLLNSYLPVWQAATMAERERAERICRNEAEQNYDISRHAWGRLAGCADMIRDGDLP